MDNSLANTESITTVPTKSDLSTATPYPTVTDKTATGSSPGKEEEARRTTTTNNNNALKKVISTRTFCLFAISSSIGAGLFVASGSALQRGGPGSLVTAFAVLGAVVWCVMLALGELSASFPVQGSFYDYSVRFVSESWGFAMGWNYVLNFALIVAFELTVMMMIAELWVPPGLGVVRSGLVAVVPACMVVLAGIQAFGARGYGEAEQVFGVLKVLILMTFVVTGIVIASGGTKEAGGRGFENWQDGKAFLHGLPGFISNFVAAGMAYGGTEMLGLAAAECKHPRKVMPVGAMIVIIRIVACYLLPLAVLGFVLNPADDFARPEFAHLHVVSPFVVAVRVAGLPVLGDVINAILLVSVFSMANASVFATSRAMVSICRRGMGPRVLGEVTTRGVPKNALGVVFVVAQLAWIAVAPKGAVIFDWLLSVASVSNYFTWGSIFVCHIRMRTAMRRQGRRLDELAWRSPLGVVPSYLGLVVILLSMLAQIASASLPSVLPTDTSRFETFFMGILGFLVVFLFFVGHLLYKTAEGRKQQQQGNNNKKSWRERVWVPVAMLALPELDARREGYGEEEIVDGEKK